MNLRDKIQALEPQILAASLSPDLVVGDEYIVHCNNTNYGIWKFKDFAGCRLYFGDDNGASLSVPKSEDELKPADGWLVIPEG